MNKIVTVKDISKRYGNQLVFSRLTFDLEEGKMIALLGSNGIGKTTLMRSLAGLINLNAGSIEYEDGKGFAMLPEVNQFPKWMRVKDAITYYQDFFCDFNRVKAQQLCIENKISFDANLSTLSRGNQEKLCLFLTLSRQVALYLLDEPFGGIDPRYRKELKASLLSNVDDACTILIATHSLLDVENVIDEVMILKEDAIVSNNIDDIREYEGKSLEDYYMEVTGDD